MLKSSISVVELGDLPAGQLAWNPTDRAYLITGSVNGVPVLVDLSNFDMRDTSRFESARIRYTLLHIRDWYIRLDIKTSSINRKLEPGMLVLQGNSLFIVGNQNDTTYSVLIDGSDKSEGQFASFTSWKIICPSRSDETIFQRGEEYYGVDLENFT
jgi:hypothetical protein